MFRSKVLEKYLCGPRDPRRGQTIRNWKIRLFERASVHFGVLGGDQLGAWSDVAWGLSLRNLQRPVYNRII